MSKFATFLTPPASRPVGASPFTSPKLTTPRSVVACHPAAGDRQYVLHDSLDASGVDTLHARRAREGFLGQMRRMSSVERETSIAINRGVNLARAALHIAAEDDALVSHSSVPLPVDAYVERLDDLAMGFFHHFDPPSGCSPELYLSSLEHYLYVHQGFQRASLSILSDTRPLYLHSVLTRRLGSVAMLSLIYSESLKKLRLCGSLDFDAEIRHPRDFVNLPRGYQKQNSKVSDEAHLMTSQSLLVEILTNLKDAFWPFQFDNTSSLFLRAAYAANCIDESGVKKNAFDSYSNVRHSGFEFASAKAAEHRLGRGVWTSVRFGDMRRALAACERLILIGFDHRELRDYSILLYHCGLYEESLKYLKEYQMMMENLGTDSLSSEEQMEKDAVDNLLNRLNLISQVKGWGLTSSNCRSFWGKFSEPW